MIEAGAHDPAAEAKERSTAMPEAPVPTYYRIKVALLEEIGRGEYVPGRSFITEREVCARFGVSRTTAVRVLGELERDGVLTRHRGRGSFVSGASPGLLEERMQGSNPRLIGCIFNALRGQHTLSIIRGIEQVCRAEGYHLLLFDSVASPQTEVENLCRAREAGVRGLIVYPADGYANAAHFEAARRDGMPLVLIDRYYPALATDIVVPDNVGAAYTLTDYLIKAGHTRIAMLWGEETACTSVVDRLAGYRQALREHGLTLQPELAVLRRYTALPHEGRMALLTSWLAAPYRPTAYLAVNSETLAMVATDLLGLSVRVPEDVVLASMDNASLDTLLAFAAVTATLPSMEMGNTAMRLLHERLSEGLDRPCRHVVLPVAVSTAPSVAVNLWLVTP
jgi:LacI family fructose operon transcriptional repressor